jgi:hypothetical protein
VRPFTEEWSEKPMELINLYRDVPFLGITCRLSNNMRVDQAVVVNIETIDPNVKLPLTFRSVQQRNFKYSIGQLASTPLDMNPRFESTNGIHVMATKKEAEEYWFL